MPRDRFSKATVARAITRAMDAANHRFREVMHRDIDAGNGYAQCRDKADAHRAYGEWNALDGLRSDLNLLLLRD